MATEHPGNVVGQRIQPLDRFDTSASRETPVEDKQPFYRAAQLVCQDADMLRPLGHDQDVVSLPVGFHDIAEQKPVASSVFRQLTERSLNLVAIGREAALPEPGDHRPVNALTLALGGAEPNRTALHGDNGMMSVPADGSRRQPEDVLRLDSFEHAFERERRKVMAFVYHDMPIVFDQLVHDTSAVHSLQHGDVDSASSRLFAGADQTNLPGLQPEKGLKSLVPLPKQLSPMHENQSVHASGCDDALRPSRSYRSQ